MARGHRLNISIVLAAVHGLSGLFGTVSAVEPSLSRPLSTLSPSLIGHLASVDVKQHESKQGFCPRFQARSKDQEIFKRREVARTQLDPQFSLPRRDHEYGGGAGLSKLDVFCFELSTEVVRQQQCNGHCLSDCPAHQLPKQQLRSAATSRWAMARAGTPPLTLPLFWRQSTVSPVFFGRFPRSSLHSLVPFPLCPRP